MEWMDMAQRLILKGEKTLAITPAQLALKYPDRTHQEGKPFYELTKIINEAIENAHKICRNECYLYLPKYSTETGMVYNYMNVVQHITNEFGHDFDIDFITTDEKDKLVPKGYSDCPGYISSFTKLSKLPKHTVTTTATHSTDTYPPNYDASSNITSIPSRFQRRERPGDCTKLSTTPKDWLHLSWPKKEHVLPIGSSKAFTCIQKTDNM